MIRIECGTWEELIDLAGKILEQKGEKAEQKAVKAEQAPAQTSASLPRDPAPAPTPAPDPIPAPTPAPAKKITRQEVQNKAIALMDTGKKAQLQALLQKYNVQALPSIPEDQLEAFMADMEAM